MSNSVVRPDMRRERVLLTLRAVWDRHPHLRFMQLVGNLIERNEDGYYLDDDEIVRRLWEYAEEAHSDHR